MSRGFISHDGNHAPKLPFVLNKDSPQAKGLVGWWPMNDTGNARNFASGHNMEGILSSDVITAPHEFSGLGKDFPAVVGQSIKIDSSLTAPLELQFMTVTVWCIPAGLSGSGLFEKTQAGTVNKSYLLFLAGAGDAWTFRVVVSGVFKTVTGSAAVQDVPHLVTGTYDGAFVRIYVNGLQTAELAETGSVDNGAGDAFFGHLGSNIFPWNGFIWDATVHNYAQSPSLIYQRYHPSTRWDLYHELERKVWFVPAAVAAGISFPPWKVPITHLLAR